MKLYREGFRLFDAELLDALGVIHPAGASDQRIVVSVGNEDLYVLLGKPFESVMEATLGGDQSIAFVIDVAGKDKERGLSIDCQIAQGLPCLLRLLF